MTLPTSEDDTLKRELIDRCRLLMRPRIGREISGTIEVPGDPYMVVIEFDTHLNELRVFLDAGMYVEEMVYNDSRGTDSRWIMPAARDYVLPVLRKHMVLDDLAGA